MSKLVLRDLTPQPYKACVAGPCPSLYQTTDGHYLIVGRLVTADSVPAGRVGPDEVVIEVPRDLIDNAPIER